MHTECRLHFPSINVSILHLSLRQIIYLPPLYSQARYIMIPAEAQSIEDSLYFAFGLNDVHKTSALDMWTGRKEVGLVHAVYIKPAWLNNGEEILCQFQW